MTADKRPALSIEQAALVAESMVEALNAISDDIASGAARFTLERFEWVDDGDDTVRVKIRTAEANR